MLAEYLLGSRRKERETENQEGRERERINKKRGKKYPPTQKVQVGYGKDLNPQFPSAQLA